MSRHPRNWDRNWEWKGARQAAPLLLLLLTGCGDDRPYSGPPPGGDRPAQAAPADTPLAAAPADSAPTDSVPTGPPDPLVGDGVQTPPDPLVGRDPLLGHDPLQGRAMPTEHSHWLQCRVLHDARVTVLLNGQRYKSYSGAVLGDDITMSLRRGLNTVTFVYQPNGEGAAADLEIVESEHHPPIAPLVTFRSTPGPATGGDTAGGATGKPVTQTFPFVAN